MKAATPVARILLGLVFTVFGLNFFIGFLPAPNLNDGAAAFMGALMQSGYVMTVVKIVEVLCGLLLLSGLFVPLALTLLAPIVVNIVLFHTVLDHSGLPVAMFVLVLQVFLAWSYRGHFKGVLSRRAKPSAR